MKNFKDTSYILLLNDKNDISRAKAEIAFYEFTNEVYEYCIKEQNNDIKYFTLQYLKNYLITFHSKRREENYILHTTGAINFVEAAIEWVSKEDKETSYSNDKECQKINVSKQVIWTGKVIHLMEFIYGSDTLKNFNNGQITIKEVAAYFSKMLGVEIKDPSGCYVSMRERIKESRTSYIDSMREALLERMEKDDEKTYRRKK